MAPRHLICRVDIGAALQQQPHQTLMAASCSQFARVQPLLRDYSIKLGRIRICRQWLRTSYIRFRLYNIVGSLNNNYGRLIFFI